MNADLSPHPILLFLVLDGYLFQILSHIRSSVFSLRKLRLRSRRGTVNRLISQSRFLRVIVRPAGRGRGLGFFRFGLETVNLLLRLVDVLPRDVSALTWHDLRCDHMEWRLTSLVFFSWSFFQ